MLSLRPCVDAALFDAAPGGSREAGQARRQARRDELAITLDDIKNFRQLGSPCPGHPEYGDTGGVETTTGPLGQGCGNSVGMAMAAKWLAAQYNRPGFDLFDYQRLRPLQRRRPDGRRRRRGGLASPGI